MSALEWKASISSASVLGIYRSISTQLPGRESCPSRGSKQSSEQIVRMAAAEQIVRMAAAEEIDGMRGAWCSNTAVGRRMEKIAATSSTQYAIDPLPQLVISSSKPNGHRFIERTTLRPASALSNTFQISSYFLYDCSPEAFIRSGTCTKTAECKWENLGHCNRAESVLKMSPL